MHAGSATSATPAPRPRDERVFRWWDSAAFLALTALNSVAIWWFFSLWFASGDWRTHPALMWVFTLLVAYNVAVHQYRWFLVLLMKRPRAIESEPGHRVAAVTTFVPGAEPLEMLTVTVRAMVAMDYPHDTWVLDEGDDDAVRAMCAAEGARHFSRKHLPHYRTRSGTYQRRSKHGNYNAWFAECGYDAYDYIAAFDPDHIPRPNFLTRALGHFRDPRVGYVQAAQVYYNQRASFIARGAAEETYGYYSATQMALHAIGYPIVTGCHQTHRVPALREVGGFAAHDADDLLITLLYRAAGWRGVYVPEVLAEGLTPVDWTGYLKQQLRWARSVLDVKFRAFPRYAGRLPFREAVLGLVHGLYYFQGLTTFVVIIVLMALLATNFVPTVASTEALGRYATMMGVLGIASLYEQRFYLLPRHEWGLHLRSKVLQIAKWPYLLFGLIDALLGTTRPYTITLKVRSTDRANMLAGPHLVIATLVFAAWMLGLAVHGTLHIALQVAAGVVVASSLILAWTDGWRFPAPYDRTVWEAHKREAGTG